MSAFAAPGSDSANPSAGYKPEQIILLKEKGKPDRKCLIVSTMVQKDGSKRYQVKALDNGEMLTIFDRPSKEPPIVPAAPVKAMPTAAPSKSLLSGDDNAPRADVPATPPAPMKLTAIAAEASVSPPIKPPSKSWWARLFGPSTKPDSSCSVCQNGNPVPLIKSQPTNMPGNPPTMLPAPGTAPSVEQVGPGIPSSKKVVPSTDPVPVPAASKQPAPADRDSAVVVTAPATVIVPVGPAVAPVNAPNSPYGMIAPTPLPKFGPIPEVNASDIKITEYKINLKAALRPSEREIAAEGLIESYKGNAPEIRALVLMAAQEDPAPTVRCACLRSLSKQGIKDQALMTVLISAQKDRDPMVREEANHCLERWSLKK